MSFVKSSQHVTLRVTYVHETTSTEGHTRILLNYIVSSPFLSLFLARQHFFLNGVSIAYHSHLKGTFCVETSQVGAPLAKVRWCWSAIDARSSKDLWLKTC